MSASRQPTSRRPLLPKKRDTPITEHLSQREPGNDLPASIRILEYLSWLTPAFSCPHASAGIVFSQWRNSGSTPPQKRQPRNGRGTLSPAPFAKSRWKGPSHAPNARCCDTEAVRRWPKRSSLYVGEFRSVYLTDTPHHTALNLTRYRGASRLVARLSVAFDSEYR